MERSLEEKTFWEDFAKQKGVENMIADKITTVQKCVTTLSSALKDCTNVLEIGSGVGRLTIPMAKKMPKAKLLGVDISYKMCELAKKAAIKAKVANVEFAMNDGRHLPKDAIGIDGAFSITTFQHVTEDGVRGYINQVGEMLVKGGVFKFQFVEGNEDIAMSQNRSVAEVKKWVNEAGMKVEKVQKGLMHDSWVWITARK
jgi:cyclopropane fatty-acyl-phospholipid synthase-like methyltransferase